jgi:maltooligosyltrehalose trehalohydrolase
VREGRRAEFGSHGWSADEVPDPQDPATRDRSVLSWAELGEEPHAAVLRWYTACTALRRELLGTGPTRFADVDVSFDASAHWFVMVHAPAGGTASAVVVNLGDDAQEVPVGGGGPAGLLLAWDPAGTTVLEAAVRLPGRSVAVVRVG